MRTQASTLPRFLSVFIVIVAVALMAAAFGQSKSAKSKATETQKISGYVADEKCSSKTADVSCTKKCADAGEKLVMVSDSHRIFEVDNQDALKGYEGKRVQIVASKTDAVVHVDKITMLAQQCLPKSCDRKPTCAREGLSGSPRCQPVCRCPQA